MLTSRCLRLHWRYQLWQQVFLLRYLPKFKLNQPWPHRQQQPQPQSLLRKELAH
jgi:hypothetical protein